MSNPTQSRGYRNRNPGNIDFNVNNKWIGQVGKETGANGRFAVFDSHENGIRTIAALLTTYYDRHKLDTVTKIINRWAPPVENHTSNYVYGVARDMGVGPDDKLNLKQHAHMFGLVKAIIRHELGGQPYTDTQIDDGLRRFGLVRPAPTLTAAARTQTGRGAITVAGVAGLATAVQPIVSTFGGSFSNLNPWVAVSIVFAGLVLAVLYVLNSRKTDERGAPIDVAPVADVVEGSIDEAGQPVDVDAIK